MFHLKRWNSLLFQIKSMSDSLMYFQLEYFPKSQKKMQLSIFDSALGNYFAFSLSKLLFSYF